MSVGVAQRGVPPEQARRALALAFVAVARRRSAPRVLPPEPAFASDEQEAFFRSEDPELLYSGWMGAGKSRILCEKAWRVALAHPGCTVGVFRKVASSLPATTLRTFLRDVMDPRRIRSSNRTENWYELDNGSRIYFLGLDPDPVTGVPSKIGSLELAWAGVDEAVEVTEGDWVMIRGRLRDPRIAYHQIAAATNPAHPKHWLLLHFTDGTDGRLMLRASGNRFLPADYLAILEGLPDNAIGRRLGKGEWSAVEGAIWRPQPWQTKAADAPARRVVVGVDWGFVHAFAAEAVGQSSTGRLSVRGELSARGLGLDQLIEPLASFAEQHAAEAFVCDPSEPGLMDQLVRGLADHRRSHGAGCRLRASVTPATNDVLAGIAAVDKALRDGMTIDPSCDLLLSELPGYTWKPARGGGFEERPVEVDDDACDALRYAVMAFEPNPSNPWAALAGSRAGGVA